MRGSEFFAPPIEGQEQTKAEVGSLGDFDMTYFQELEGKDGWIAIGQENCKNQKYFTVFGTHGERLGIIGAYDTEDETNLTHIVVDPKYRGQGLATKFYQRLTDELNLPFIDLTINLDNKASIKAAEKLPGIERISDEQYETAYHKVKYRYKNPKAEQIK